MIGITHPLQVLVRGGAQVEDEMVDGTGTALMQANGEAVGALLRVKVCSQSAVVLSPTSML